MGSLEELLEELPARYVNVLSDVLYQLVIFRKGGLWYVRYESDENKESYHQQQSIELKLATIEMIKMLKSNKVIQ